MCDPPRVMAHRFSSTYRSQPDTMTTSPASPLRVFVVDDHPIVREGLARLLECENDIEVCGTAANLDGAVSGIHTQQPDVAVVDLALGTESGLVLVERLKATAPNIRTLVLSMHDERVYAERALQAGALGYIMKEVASDKIAAAIRRVAQGKVYLSNAMTESMVNRAVHGKETTGINGIAQLSDRELETLRLTGLGQTSSQIASQLHLSVKTVENYKERIKKKLGLRNAQELARYAFEFAANRLT